MHIGKLARQAGTTTRTVRYYEEMGLIRPERRTSGGFRCHAEEQLGRLQMILSLKELGFDLENHLPGPAGRPFPLVDFGTRGIHELF